MPFAYWATSTSTGIASIASSPKHTAARAARLLLDIRTAGGRGADRAPDHAGDRDQREHVRQRLEERPPLVAVRRRQPVGERTREAEEQRRTPGREWTPLAEDERSQADEAGTRGHLLVEGVHEADREVGAAHCSDCAGGDDSD